MVHRHCVIYSGSLPVDTRLLFSFNNTSSQDDFANTAEMLDRPICLGSLEIFDAQAASVQSKIYNSRLDCPPTLFTHEQSLRITKDKRLKTSR